MKHACLATNVLGTRIATVNLNTALEQVSAWLSAPPSPCRYMCVTGVHGIMEGVRDEKIRDIHNRADMCVPDGMPLTWVGHIRRHRNMARVYGPDLMLELLELSTQEGWSHFFYGGAPGVADDLATRLRSRFRGLKIAGTYCPPFRPLTEEERAEVLREINGVTPDIVWVGLSTPKQETLMAQLSPDIRAKLMIGVGAAFDFHTGRVRQAPRWIQRVGMEWFFRLCMEPRRLSGRYLRNNPVFLWLIALQLLGLRKFPFTRGSSSDTESVSS